MDDRPLRSSFHTHSSFCDGEGTLRDVVDAAVAAGLSDLGFSSHAPLPFVTDWNMPLARLDDYVAQIKDLGSEFADQIRLWRGLELDVIPTQDIRDFQASKIHGQRFDYYVGSVHFLGDGETLASFDGSPNDFERILSGLYSGSIEAMVSDYYRRVAAIPDVDGLLIVGHFDVIKRFNFGSRYFSGDESWYQTVANETLESIAGRGAVIELNTAGWRKNLGEPYPSPWILERCRDLQMPVAVTADAHSPQQLDWGFGEAVKLLNRLRITPVNPADILIARAQV